MSTVDAPSDLRSQRANAAVAHEIRIECERALRRLDGLRREHDDVLLDHARAFVRRAANLSEQIVGTAQRR